jgi:membrane associated rhomboid family serine protease
VLGDAYLPEDIIQAPGWLTPLTSLFLHGNLMHLAGNMLFLWVFGDNVEDSMGHWRFLAFFLVCGVMAAFGHALTYPDSVQPLIGASGAISGIIAAYLLLHPRVRVWGLVLKYLPIAVPAWVAIGAWIAVQVLQGLFGGESAIAWFAHLGGLAAGVLLTPFFIRRDISIRQRWAR